jgi:nicotinamidase/pyrazinamidase
MPDEAHFKTGDALLIVDVQVDFCPGGALAVHQGDQVVPEINTWIRKAVEDGIPVLASRDWHPRNHISFTAEGGPWPPHCIQDSAGAAFRKDLQLPDETVVITKGVRFDQDQNSAFDQTGLEVHLKRQGVRRVFIAGLALDVCVLATALDARRHGLQAVLLRDATRPVVPEDAEAAIERLRKAGVTIQEQPAEVAVCTKAPEWAEHQRFSDDDDTCDDGRAG